MAPLNVALLSIIDVCCIDVLLALEKACKIPQKRKKIDIPGWWWPPVFKGPFIVTPIGPMVDSHNQWLYPPFDHTPFRKAYIHGIATPRICPHFDRTCRYIVNHPEGFTSECVFENWVQGADGSYFLLDEYQAS